MTIAARRATARDIDDLMRLREVMVAGDDGAVEIQGEWIEHARTDLRERLPETDGDFAAFVVDDADGRPVSCGYGVIQQTVATGRRPHGRAGYVFNVATEPEYRGRGYATAVMEKMLAWFTERGIKLVDLRSTKRAESMYERLGFMPYEERTFFIDLSPRAPSDPQQ